MMRVLWDPVQDTVHALAPMPEVQSTGEQNFHLQCTRTCVTPSHPHPPQTSSSQKHGMMMQHSQNETSQQCHWMMKCSLKIQFQIDTSAATKHLMSQITSVPVLVHTDALPLWWTCYIQNHEVKQCLTMNWWDFCHISSDLPDIMIMMSYDDILDLADVLDAVWFT